MGLAALGPPYFHWTYEPPTFYERNEQCRDTPSAALCQCAEPVEAPVASVSTPPRRKPVVAGKEEALIG